jgi:hypothetical protein
MKRYNFKRYKFDEIIRFLTILVLVIFSSMLVLAKSDLSRDVIFLIIGVIGGRYTKA